MGIEIERKFLVKDDSWRPYAQSPHQLTQGYLSTSPQCTVRIRQEISPSGQRSWLTLKGAGTGIVRPEFEYVIPWEDGIQMMELLGQREPLKKNRYRVEFRGHIWEVDEFLGVNAGLVVAEITLREASETFDVPQWAGQEVSDDPRYLNSRLYEIPYKLWDPATPLAGNTPKASP